MSNWGFVYCLSNESMPGLYKIGYTTRSPMQRAEELSRSTGVPTSFDVWFYLETQNPAQVVMSQWIKCSERMPEIGVPVLIRIPVCGHWNIENGEYKGDGLWYGAWCSTRGKDKCYKVTQWAEQPSEPL